MMQGPSTNPTEDDDASLPTEHMRNRPHLSAGFRKAATRALPWDLAEDEIQLALPRPQDEDEGIREAKRRRFEDPSSASSDKADTTENTSRTTTVALAPHATADALKLDHAESDSVMDVHPNVVTTATFHCWTPEEDAKLTSAVMVTSKKKRGVEHRIDWVAVATLVPGRTNIQCWNRWYNALVSKLDSKTARLGHWKADEDKTLKDAVRVHSGKNWKKVAALVHGRTTGQCRDRWHYALVSNIDPTTARAGRWTAVEDKKLKDAVVALGDKDWGAIVVLIPGRTYIQCRNRWHDALVSSIDPTTARAGKWTSDENKRLKDAVQAHGAKNWETIAALVPGRTKVQCRSIWNKTLVSNIDPTTARVGKWTADEDRKLKDTVLKHDGKNWNAIAALVPGRTKGQCSDRWHKTMVSSIDPMTARAGPLGVLVAPY